MISGSDPVPRAAALIPFGIFLVFYLGVSLWLGDFYSIPMPVAFILAGAAALLNITLRQQGQCPASSPRNQ